MVRLLYAGSAAAILVLGGAMSAHATVTDNASLSSPPGVYFGSGNSNSNFTVDTENGIELGLSAITRFVGPIAPSPALSNVYEVPIGATAVSGKSGAAWGFVFSINLQPGASGGPTLGDITAKITLTDVVNATTGSFDPLVIPDNAEFGSSGVVQCPNAGCGPSNWAAQNSEALSFASIATALGDPLFNQNANDTYLFTLDVSSLAGALLASDTIVVNAGTGAPVPEPASLALLGTGLLGFGALRRRRKA